MLRNPVNKHFKLITCEEGDWEILEEDGREVASAHSLGNHVWIELLRSLGHTVDEECISNEEMEVRC